MDAPPLTPRIDAPPPTPCAELLTGAVRSAAEVYRPAMQSHRWPTCTRRGRVGGEGRRGAVRGGEGR
eukprot:scaffold70432_cov61-Phaeocystis_antarctica.AAC.1